MVQPPANESGELDSYNPKIHTIAIPTDGSRGREALRFKEEFLRGAQAVTADDFSSFFDSCPA